MWRRRRPLDGLDDDIRAHIQHETDDYIARGVQPEEAHRLARLAFGNVATVREDVRALWHRVWLEQLLQDFTFALRLLRRTPLFTSAVVLSLDSGAAPAPEKPGARHWIRRQQLQLAPRPGPGSWKRSRG